MSGAVSPTNADNAAAGNGSSHMNGGGSGSGGYSTAVSSNPRAARSRSSLSGADATTSSPPGSAKARRSSTIQDMTDLLKDTTDQVLQPAVAPDSGSHWNSIPLAFALLPAVAGVFFNNGSVVVTDVILLFLTAVFLHWLIKFPW